MGGARSTRVQSTRKSRTMPPSAGEADLGRSVISNSTAAAGARRTLELAAAAALTGAHPAAADENGVSFWVPGTFGSLAAVPLPAGWSLTTSILHQTLHADGATAFSRQVGVGPYTATLNANVSASLDEHAELFLGGPSYTFEQPVLGGQLTLRATLVYGYSRVDSSAQVSGTVGPFPFFAAATYGDSVTDFGDFYPMAALRWNSGNHNFLAYTMSDVPVGSYDANRLSNLGIGHTVLDGGAGYTYLNTENGREFSAVAGVTYNFANPTTNYQNGADLHLDWGASQFLSEHVHVGLVGYVYQQVGDDSGALPIQGGFRSGIAAVGPQAGYILELGGRQAYVNLKAYREFAAVNRSDGWNAWLTFTIALNPKRAGGT